MTIDKDIILEKFRHFNALIFQGVLPEIPIKVGSARSRLGTFCYRRQMGPDGTMVNSDFHFRFSRVYDLPEETWEDIIIHEMIHYLLAYRGTQDKTPHGREFRSIMKTINQRFGRHITISYKVKTPVKKKENLISKTIRFINIIGKTLR